MSQGSNADQGTLADAAHVAFRCLHDETDYAHMLTIMTKSAEADHIIEDVSLDDIKRWYAPSARFDPNRDILFAELNKAGGEAAVVGFGRVSWYTGLAGARLYTQSSYVLPEWRDQGIWPEIIRRNEQRLWVIAAGHPSIRPRFFQAWVTEAEAQKIAVLKGEGYQAVRHFRNMLRRLESVPEQALPQGLDVRPVRPEHFRRIWEARKEVNQELFEYVAENWAESAYQSWLADSSHTYHLWQVAWDGDQVAGMVLPRIDEVENRELKRKRGYTEDVFVRRPWRRRGLARALVVRCLQALKAQGMEETELGVDSENDSGAFAFYQRLGYETYSTDIWLRKPMDVE